MRAYDGYASLRRDTTPRHGERRSLPPLIPIDAKEQYRLPRACHDDGEMRRMHAAAMPLVMVDDDVRRHGIAEMADRRWWYTFTVIEER